MDCLWENVDGGFMKKRNTVIQISLSVITIALVTVGTMVLRIPNPMGGYFNLGDVMVLFVR